MKCSTPCKDMLSNITKYINPFKVAMKQYCKSMGVYSKSETHKFMDSDGILVEKKVQYIADVPKFLIDMFGAGKGACVSLDSGQGKFIVVANGYDPATIGDESGVILYPKFVCHCNCL